MDTVSGKPNELLGGGGGNLAMDWHPIPSASVCHYCTFLFQFFIKNEGNQMDTVSGKPNEMLGGTDFIYPPFILSGENWVSTPVGPWCCDFGQETLLSPYLFSPSVIKE